RRRWPALLAGGGLLALAVAAGLAWRSQGTVPPAPAAAAAAIPPESVAPAPAVSFDPEVAGELESESPVAWLAAPPARVPGRIFPLAVRRIVLDPGHGGGDEGTRTSSGLLEKNLTLDIAQRLATRLRAIGIEVVLTRETDARVALVDLAALAGRSGADLFVSIHVIWLQDGRANRGIETFYLGPSDDPAVTRLA